MRKDRRTDRPRRARGGPSRLPVLIAPSDPARPCLAEAPYSCVHPSRRPTVAPNAAQPGSNAAPHSTRACSLSCRVPTPCIPPPFVGARQTDARSCPHFSQLLMARGSSVLTSCQLRLLNTSGTRPLPGAPLLTSASSGLSPSSSPHV